MDVDGRLSLRGKALTGALFFLCAFALFSATHVASLYLDDSGETVTVAASLGIGHPPGYPLHTLLGRLATLLPLGPASEPANLLGALFGAAAGCAACVVLLGRSRGLGLLPAALAAATPAALLCLGPVFWHNALGAKGSVYQLNNLLSLLLLGLLADPAPSGRRLRAFWLLLGLAFAHHYMSQLPLLPVYAWLLWPVPFRRWLREAWLVAPGALLYAYLPLRSAQAPELDWGGVHSLAGFWFYFFRLQYAAGELTRSALTSLAQAWYALKLLVREGSGLLAAGALASAWALRRGRWTQALALGWAASLASVAFYLNLKPDRLDLMQPYLFPAYLCQALLAGSGLLALLPRLGLRLRPLLLGLGMAATAALGAWQWPQQDLSDYYFAVDSARGLLLGLPRDALLLCQGDAVIFPLWYLQRVLGERRDVATVGLAVLPMDWVRLDLARHWPDLHHPVVQGPIGAESVPALTRAYLDLNPQRRAYASFNAFDPGVGGWDLVSEGQAFRCVRLPVTPTAASVDLPTALRRLEAVPIRGFTRRPLDPRTLTLVLGDLGVRYNVLGVGEEDAKRYPQALDLYSHAARLAPEDPNFAFNRGNALYEVGRREEAADAFLTSVKIDPGYINGWYNRGVTLFQMGRVQEAHDCFLKAHQLDPARSDLMDALRQSGGV